MKWYYILIALAAIVLFVLIILGLYSIIKMGSKCSREEEDRDEFERMKDKLKL